MKGPFCLLQWLLALTNFYALRIQTFFSVRNPLKDIRKFAISGGALVTRFGGTGKRDPVGLYVMVPYMVLVSRSPKLSLGLRFRTFDLCPIKIF
jgi:hypothetical protein